MKIKSDARPARNPAGSILPMNCTRCGFDQQAHGHVSNICPDHRGFFSHPALDLAAAPPAPAVVQFVAVGASVMRGAEHIATAVSNTFARRIARALNEHKPNSRGV
jgi:hypothetical protein